MRRKLLALCLILVLIANACITIQVTEVPQMEAQTQETAIEEVAEQESEIDEASAQEGAADETPSEAAETAEAEVPDVETSIYEISKYGNLVLSLSYDELMEIGYKLADIIRVKIGSAEIEMPIGTAYSDADSGEPVCVFKTSSTGVNVINLAINSGDLATTLGIAKRSSIDEEPGYMWTYAEGLEDPVTVHISLAEKQGYADEYAMHQLGSTRTNKREDYETLSDAEYANFRAVETTGMGKGLLYRSSSPIRPALNRNAEADAALLEAGIRTVVNMADKEELMTQYENYESSNYSNCDIIALDMSMDFFSDDFTSKLAKGFRYMASHEGPYLLHCNEGKDRTGYACAILECLMGASLDEIIQDYMLTYYNFYGITAESEQYSQIAESNIINTLKKTFGITSMDDKNVDLQACAESYLLSIGLSDDDIICLKDQLD